ncbi:hypothetical protein Plhal304r1_c003g0010931 [Plasmopara halstedii]
MTPKPRLAIQFVCFTLLSGSALFLYNDISATDFLISWSVTSLKAHEPSDLPLLTMTDQVRFLRAERMAELPVDLQKTITQPSIWKKITQSRQWKSVEKTLALMRKKVKKSKLRKMARKLLAMRLKVTNSRIWKAVVSFLLYIKNKLSKLHLVHSIASSWLVKTLAPSLYVRFAANKQAAVDDLFLRYKNEASASKLLESPSFEKWATVVEKAYGEDDRAGAAMISTLANHYKDDAKLATIITQAHKKPATHDMANHLLYTLVNKWLRSGKQIDEEKLYALLRLDVTKSDFLKSPALQTWLLLCTALGKDTVPRHKFLLLKLLEHYDYDTLDKMLAANIAEGGSSSAVASMLRLVSWRMRGYEAEEVYEMLRQAIAANLNHELGGVQANGVKFGEMVGEAKTGKVDDVLEGIEADKINDMVELTALRGFIVHEYQNEWDGGDFIEGLLKKLKKEEDLARAVASRPIDDGFNHDLDYVRGLLIYYWLSRQWTAAEVFDGIKLNADADSLFENPVLRIWMTFAEMRDKNSAFKDI